MTPDNEELVRRLAHKAIDALLRRVRTRSPIDRANEEIMDAHRHDGRQPPPAR
jgi:hypothetical protein